MGEKERLPLPSHSYVHVYFFLNLSLSERLAPYTFLYREYSILEVKRVTGLNKLTVESRDF